MGSVQASIEPSCEGGCRCRDCRSTADPAMASIEPSCEGGCRVASFDIGDANTVRFNRALL